jgi:O-antigen/teichoic acid export membrane protein
MNVPANPEPTKTVPSVLATMTKNSVANLFRSGSAWVIVLFLPPLLVHAMDKSAYGVWLLLLQLAAYISIFDGGIQLAVSRYVARAEELKDHGHLARLLSSAGMLLIVSGVLTILLFVLVSWRLTDIFRDIPASIAHSAREALLVIGTSLALTLPFSVVAGFFLGRQKNEIPALAAIFGKFTGALGIAWAAYHHQGLLAMAIWIGFGNLMQCLIYLISWNREENRAKLRPSLVEVAMVRKFLVFCSAMFVTQFSMILITGLDLPIVAAFDFRSVAYYGVASILSNALTVPHGAIVSTLLPVAAGISAGDDPQRLGQTLVKTTRVGTAVLILITLPLSLLMPLVLRVWVGPDYAAHSLFIAETLVLAQFARLTLFPYAIIGFAAGQQHRMLVAALGEAIVNLICSLALVQVIGARGVALGTLIGAVVGVCLHLTVSLSKTDRIQTSRSELIRLGILKPLAFAVPFVICTILVARFLSPIFHVLLVASAEIALSALLWRFSFDSNERKQLLGVFLHFAAVLGKTLPRRVLGSS